MKKCSFLNALAALVLIFAGCAQTQAQTKSVIKYISTNGLTENLVVPSGKTLTIKSGATITVEEGATVNGLEGGGGGGLTGLASSISGGTVTLSGTLTTGRTWTFPDAAGTFASQAWVGVGYQPLDADLTSLAGLTTTSYGRSLLELANAAALRTSAGLVIGTDVQAYNANTTLLGSSIDLTSEVTGILPLANGGTGASLSDPGADRIAFWDHSAGAFTWLTLGDNLSITGTTLNATGGGSGLDNINSSVTGAMLTIDGVLTGDRTLTARDLSGTIALLSDFTGYLTETAADAAYQPLNTHLTDLSDGTLTGSKVGTGINAANITTGTLPSAQLPVAGTSAIGAVKRNAGSSGQFVSGIDTDGSLIYSTPSGGGDVLGPGSSVANYLAVADGTTGKVIKYSAKILDDGGTLRVNSPVALGGDDSVAFYGSAGAAWTNPDGGSLSWGVSYDAVGAINLVGPAALPDTNGEVMVFTTGGIGSFEPLPALGANLEAIKAMTPAQGDLIVGTASGWVKYPSSVSDGQVLMADSSDSAGMSWQDLPSGGNPAVMKAGAPNSTTVNTTTETTVATYTVPANSIAAGDLFRVRVVGDLKNWSAGSITATFRLVFGSTTLISTSGESFAQHTTRRSDWTFECMMACPSTSSQQAQAIFQKIINAGVDMNAPSLLFGVTDTGAEATTSNKDLKVTVQMNTADANVEFRIIGYTIEKISATP